MNPLLEVLQSAATKVADLGSQVFNSDSLGSGGMSVGMPSQPPLQAPDATQMLQNDIGMAGIENEAVGFLEPAPPMPFSQIPQLPYMPPQKPQETERERILRENLERIQQGEAPPVAFQAPLGGYTV